MEEHQGWAKTEQGNITQLKLGSGSLCLSLGDKKDAQSGQPSAQLAACSNASILSLEEGRIQESPSGLCLDITAHGRVAGEPLEWYPCSDDRKTNANQHFTL